MRWNILAYLHPSNLFRRRSVHLLYLVFLIIIFSFIPTTGDRESASDLPQWDMAQWNLRHSKAQALLFLQLLDPATPTYNDLKFDLLSYEKWAGSSLTVIQELNELVSSGKDISEEVSAKLFNQVRRFLDELSKGPYGLDKEWVAEILPFSRFVEDERGRLREFHRYHFVQKNRDGQMRYLNKLKERVIFLQAMGNQQAIQERAKEFPELHQLLIHSSADLNYSELYESPQLGSILLNEDFSVPTRKQQSAGMDLDLHSGTDLVVGEAIHFILNSMEGDAVTVRISGPGGTELFRMLEAGPFIYFPKVSGIYYLSLRSSLGQWQEQFRFRPQVQRALGEGLQRLTLGERHSVAIPREMNSYASLLFFEEVNCKVSLQGTELIVTGSEAGQGRVSVKARMAYGDITVIEYPFEFIAPSAVQLRFSEQDGELLRIHQLTPETSLSSRQTGIRIVGYNLSLLPALSGTAVQQRYNSGAALNTRNLQMLRSGNPGDRLLIDQVQAVNAAGKAVEVSPLVLRLR